jgi:O-antigen/teichoic acid export membrane protein
MQQRAWQSVPNRRGDPVHIVPQQPQRRGRLAAIAPGVSRRGTKGNDWPSHLARAAVPGGRIRLGRIRLTELRPLRDPMVRNSLYLILSSGLQASLGFAFWIVAARLFSTDQTGLASSLISATIFLSLMALMGLNVSFGRYLPAATNRDSLITGGVAVVAVSGLAAGAVYVLVAPTIAPKLAFVEQSLPLAIGFIIFTSASSVNLLTDAIFVGSRKSGYVALTDGAIAGTVKMAALFLLVGFGAVGLYTASTTGLAAAALASLLLIGWRLGWRPHIQQSMTVLKPLAKFSTANYVCSLLTFIPQTVVPIVILDRLGASAAAYYYVAYQVASLAQSPIYAIQGITLTEGGLPGANLASLVKRSVRLMLVVCLPVVVVVIVGAHWILLLFGTRYSIHGTFVLIVLVASALPASVMSLLRTLLNLLGRLNALVWSSVLFAAVICGAAWLLAPHGLIAFAAAWPIGTAASAVPCGVSLIRRWPIAARHRKGAHAAAAATESALLAGAGARADRDFAETQRAGLAALLSLADVSTATLMALRDVDFDAPSVGGRWQGGNSPRHGQPGVTSRHRRDRPRLNQPQ